MKLSINKLAELTGLDRRRIKRCLEPLNPETEGRTLLYESRDAIPLLYAVTGYEEHLDLTQERARLARFQGDKAELEAKRLKGELIDVNEAAEVIGAELANVRARLLSLPGKVAPELVGIDDLAVVHSHLQTAIHDALAELVADTRT